MTAPSTEDQTVDLSTVLRQSPRVVSRLVKGEHILVPLASRGVDLDSIFNLNATGTFIWEKIDGQRTGVEIAALLAEDFEVASDRAMADCRGFLGQLLEVRAVELVGAAAVLKA